MKYVGVDPGLHGAICFMDSFGGVKVHDLPVITDGKLKWIDGSMLGSLFMDHENMPNGFRNEKLAVVERVHAMPKQGVSSSFNFGVGFGSILSVLQVHGVPIEFVQPSVWKKALGLSQDKKASLHKARLLYPDAPLELEKHEGRAEAILIAHYARTARGR